MCQTIPRKVLQVTGEHIEVLYDGVPRWLPVHGLPDLAPGEYVTVYAGAVLERMPVAEAEEILHFYAELEDLMEAAND
jgi:hydrogenase assembly chaperone HypC/HupF